MNDFACFRSIYLFFSLFYSVASIFIYYACFYDGVLDFFFFLSRLCSVSSFSSTVHVFIMWFRQSVEI